MCCPTDKLPPAIKMAKCMAITMLVFAILNVLEILWLGASIIVGLQPPLVLQLAFGLACLGGVLGIVSTTLVIQIPNVEQTDVAKAAQKVKLGWALGVGAVGQPILVIGMIFAIISIPGLLKCSKATDCHFLRETLPADCVMAACQELNYPQPGWNSDEDCAAVTSRCAGGQNHYVSSTSALAWRDDAGVGRCAPKTCCSTASEPPTGYVAFTDHTCPANDPTNCHPYQELCAFVTPAVYALVGWHAISAIVFFVHVLTVANARKHPGVTKHPGVGPGIRASASAA